MVTESELYWITRLDPINIFAGVSLTLSIIVGLVSIILWGVNYLDENEELMKSAKRWSGWSFLATIFMSVILMFTPTMKEMCAIKIVPAIMNNELVQTVGNEFYSLAVEWMRELHPSKSNTVNKIKGEIKKEFKKELKDTIENVN